MQEGKRAQKPGTGEIMQATREEARKSLGGRVPRPPRHLRGKCTK